MMIQLRSQGVLVLFLSFISCSFAFTTSAEAKSTVRDALSGNTPLLIKAAERRDEIIEIISSRGIVSNEIEVYVPDASFIKLHFNKFKLPRGLVIEVSNPDGTEVYRYSNSRKDTLTFDSGQGDDGVTSFSAMSISGDSAVIRVLGKRGLVQALKHRVEIDYFMEGLPEDSVSGSRDFAEPVSQIQSTGREDNFKTESRCGSEDRADAVCWAGSHPTEFDRSRPVAKLLINGNTLCTAWRVGSGNHLLTNRHCLPDQAKTTSTEVWFNYQTIECGVPEVSSGLVKVAADNLLINNADLDYTLFTVNQFEAVSDFGYLGLDIREGMVGDRIYIPQHGSGAPKQFSIESDMNISGHCEIDDVDLNAYVPGTDVGYFCDTTGGSSGSPVLSEDTNRVIALHHLGGCLNQGVSVSLIWPEISEFFGNVVPTGDDEDPSTNNPPEAQFSIACAGLHCIFDASSSFDSDGNIVSYDWNLGDGNTTSGMYISHDYVSEGSFEIVLSARDNDGANGQHANTVSLTTGNASPVAVFLVACDQGICNFDATSSYDSDGAVSTYAWDFGDGNSIETPNSLYSHEYAAGGDYLVKLTVQDNLAATGNAESWVNVVLPDVNSLELTAIFLKQKGRKSVQLSWSGAVSSQVDIFRDGDLLTTTQNDGEYTDNKLPKRSKSASYQLCQINSLACTAEINVRF